MFCEVESGAVVEIWIEFMDHGFIAKDAEETSDECEDVD